MLSADSGVKSPQPGGELSEGRKGEGQRGLRATYSRGDALIKAGSKGIEGGERGLLLGLDHRREKRLEIDDDRWGPRSVRGREKRVPIRLRRDGLRARFATGPKRFPGVQFHFYFVFLLFSYSDFSFEF
jgi:hypothetical protein